MDYEEIRILILSKDEKKCHRVRDIFLNIRELPIIIDWKISVQGGLDCIRIKPYEICVFIDFPYEEYLLKKFTELSINKKMLFCIIKRFEKEKTSIVIIDSCTLEKQLDCQPDINALPLVIPLIIKNIYIKNKFELKVNNLLKSRDDLLNVTNANIDGLLVIDRNGYVLFGNPAAGRFYDCSPEDLRGKKLSFPGTNNNISKLEILSRYGRSCIIEARFADIEWRDKKASLVSLRDITEQEHLMTALRRASINDDLTGLLNRREIKRLLADEISRCIRYNYSSSVIMFDIDNFKGINDTFGHAAGDDALKWIGQIINKEIRSVDQVARYGGDEFIVLLPSVDHKNAVIPSERICSAIAQRPCYVDIEGEKQISLSLTISIGLVEIPRNGRSLESILKSVDRALYKAKKRGGNCVVEQEKPNSDI